MRTRTTTTRPSRPHRARRPRREPRSHRWERRSAARVAPGLRRRLSRVRWQEVLDRLLPRRVRGPAPRRPADRGYRPPARLRRAPHPWVDRPHRAVHRGADRPLRGDRPRREPRPTEDPHRPVVERPGARSVWHGPDPEDSCSVRSQSPPWSWPAASSRGSVSSRTTRRPPPHRSRPRVPWCIPPSFRAQRRPPSRRRATHPRPRRHLPPHRLPPPHRHHRPPRRRPVRRR